MEFQPFRAFPSPGAVAPLDAHKPSCRSVSPRAAMHTGNPECVTATPRPLMRRDDALRDALHRPVTGNRRSLPRRPRLQGFTPRGESVAHREPGRLAGARCSPGFQTSDGRSSSCPRYGASAAAAPRGLAWRARPGGPRAIGSVAPCDVSLGSRSPIDPKAGEQLAPCEVPRSPHEPTDPKAGSSIAPSGVPCGSRCRPTRRPVVQSYRARPAWHTQRIQPGGRSPDGAQRGFAWCRSRPTRGSDTWSCRAKLRLARPTRATRRSSARPRRAASRRGGTETGWLHFRSRSPRPSRRSTSSASSSVRVGRSPGSWFRLRARTTSPQ
jgi:hypothetical protein